MNDFIQALARSLADQGAQFAFGVTGSGPSLDLITALENLGIRYYPTSHEAAAAIMAGTVSHVTGKPSVSISIKGPGVTNMIPGITHNHLENNPAVSVSEAYGDNAPFFRKHKRLDQTGLLAPLVKGILPLSQLEKVPDLLQFASEEAPGPVHIELATKNQKEWAKPKKERSQEGTLDPILQKIRRSQRPILVVGSFARRRKWGEVLSSLRIPIFTTAAARGIVDENSPHSAGIFTGDGRELSPEAHLFKEGDLVVGIGLRNNEVITPKPFGLPTVLLDEVDHGFMEGFQAELSATSIQSEDAKIVLEELQTKSWGEAEIRPLKEKMRNRLLDSAWLPANCFRVLNDLSFSHTLVLDTGSFCTIGEHLWEARPGRLFLGSNNGRYMGVGVPTAIGAALARPKSPTFCVVGDGGMRTYPGELKLAVEEKLPICLILMSDGSYGSITSVPQERPMSRRATTVPQPSWRRAVEGMGISSCETNSEDSFAKAVHDWDRKAPFFIEAKFPPQPYAEMTQQLR